MAAPISVGNSSGFCPTVSLPFRRSFSAVGVGTNRLAWCYLTLGCRRVLRDRALALAVAADLIINWDLSAGARGAYIISRREFDFRVHITIFMLMLRSP